MLIFLGEGDQTHALKRDGTFDTILDFRTTYFDITMSGDQESNPNGSKATAIGTAGYGPSNGHMFFHLNSDGIDIDGKQTVTSLDNLVDMHIHKGPPGVSGGAVYNVLTDASTVLNAATGEFTGDWSSSEGLSGTNLDLLLGDGLYFNIHTPAFPAGEIRGQIVQQDEGNDRVDLRQLNIGSLTQLKAITKDVDGSATISFMADGVQNGLVLNGFSESDFERTHFLFSRSTADQNGTANADDLFASSKGTSMNGFGGSDRLLGGNAGDDLFGGSGNDRLTGGKGLDNLDGGSGRDRFIFKSAGDSGASPELADVIAAFQPGKDTLDLSRIDADAGTAGNQAFTYINEDPFSAAGQVRQFVLDGVAITEINVDGGLTADMVIKIASGVKWQLSDLDA